MHPLAEADLVHQVHRRLLEHARAHALLDVLAVARLEDHGLDAPQLEQPARASGPRGRLRRSPPGYASATAYLILFAMRTSVCYANTCRDHFPRRCRRRSRPRRRHRRAGGLHPPDPRRRRAGDHPPAQARPDAGADDAGHRLRPADRRRLRAQADLLLGRQPGRRLAAPLPRGGADAATLEIEEHSHAGHGQPLRRRRVRPAVRGHARLQRHVAARAHGHDQADHLPVHRRVADRGAGARPRRRRSSTPSGPTARATSSCGARPASRRRPCSAPSARIVTVEEIVDELDDRPVRASSSRAGSSPACARSPAARSRPTRRTTTTATTTPTRRGTRSARTASSSTRGWRTL